MPAPASYLPEGLLQQVLLLRMGSWLVSGSGRGNRVAHRARSRTQLEEFV